MKKVKKVKSNPMVADGYYALTQEDFDKFCPSYSQTAVIGIESVASAVISPIADTTMARVKKIEVYRLANLCLYKVK